jgi:DNA-binding MarR family transcriptional regulator
MNNDDLYATLYALYTLSRATLPIDAGAIGRLISLTPTQVASALIELERAGLVNASRARLTMAGLAIAVSSKGKASAGRLRIAAVRDKAPAPALSIAALPYDTYA